MSEEEIRNKFGFFIDAFQYGTPPHGGLAFGLDRIAMILSESDSIRDVIAFPKNANAKCPMSKAPTPVDPAQLEELHIEIKNNVLACQTACFFIINTVFQKLIKCQDL